MFTILKVNALETNRHRGYVGPAACPTFFRIIAYTHVRIMALETDKANTEVAEQTDCCGGYKAYKERGKSEILYFSHAGAQPK